MYNKVLKVTKVANKIIEKEVATSARVVICHEYYDYFAKSNRCNYIYYDSIVSAMLAMAEHKSNHTCVYDNTYSTYKYLRLIPVSCEKVIAYNPKKEKNLEAILHQVKSNKDIICNDYDEDWVCNILDDDLIFE